jgi:hypothetical protein
MFTPTKSTVASPAERLGPRAAAALLSAVAIFSAGFAPSAPATSPGPRTITGDGVDVLADCTPTAPQVEVALAVDPSDQDHLVVACMDWGGSAQVVKHAVTFDGGATWSCSRLRLDAGDVLLGDPELLFDANGDVQLFDLAALGPGGNSIRVRKSTDGGLTYGRARVISVDAGDDKPKAAICRAPVAHQDRIVVTWTRTDATFSPDRVVAAFSDDDGRTWSAPVILNDLDSNGGREEFGSEPGFASDGDLFVAWQDEAPREIWIDRSTDGGATFGTDVLISAYTNPPNPLPGFHFDLKPIFALAIDNSGGPHDGRLCFAWHTWNTVGAVAHADVMLSTSSDDGRTWSSIVANPGDLAPTDQFMPDVDVDPWGGVNLMWLDRRSDPAGVTLEAWGGRSLDGGATIAIELALGDEPFDPSTDAFGGAFIGHYNSLASHSRLALACWADNRAGADSEDLFLDSWNTGLTLSAETISAATGGRIDLAITPGPNLGGATYLALATFSGVSPPLIVDGIAIDLVWDELTTLCRLCPNGGPMFNGIGLLGTDGSAVAALDSLGPFDPAFAGEVVDVVAIFFDAAGDVVHATVPERITLVP